MGNYQEATKYYLQSLSVYDKLSLETPNMLGTCISIAGAYETTNQFQEAIRYYHRALEVSRKINSNKKTAIFSRLCSVLRKVGNNEEIKRLETEYGMKA